MNEQTLRVARTIQFLDRGAGVRVWDAAEYLARHDPEARYSSPLKMWWHNQILVVVSGHSGGGFSFVHRGGGLYKVIGQIPLSVPEPLPLEPGWFEKPHLPGL